MPDLSIMVLAAGVLGTLVLGFVAFAGPSVAKAGNRRLEAVRERHTRSNEMAAQAQLKRILASREASKVDNFMQQLIPNPALLRLRLEKTGKTWTIGQYAMVSLSLSVVVILLLQVRGAPLLLSIFGGLAVGIGLPHMIVNTLIKRRVAQFTSKFPDAIELMVRGLRSGLPISETIGIVGNELPGPIGVEFQSVADKMRIGKTMDIALQDSADRLGTPEMQFFCITLAIQRETGGNLAETLSNLADVLRKRAAMKLKIKAMSSESKASAWIVGSLPFIVFGLIWSINPSYIGDFFVDERLMIAGFGGLVWMGIGVAIMAKMVNFEI